MTFLARSGIVEVVELRLLIVTAAKRASGYVPGAERDETARVHPDLVSWDQLPEERGALPQILARVGLTLQRLTVESPGRAL